MTGVEESAIEYCLAVKKIRKPQPIILSSCGAGPITECPAHQALNDRPALPLGETRKLLAQSRADLVFPSLSLEFATDSKAEQAIGKGLPLTRRRTVTPSNPVQSCLPALPTGKAEKITWLISKSVLRLSPVY
jgi:hypothetical protein